jgi:catechol-2,3-dioxygenase
MIIKRDLTITDVPGFDSLTVERTGEQPTMWAKPALSTDFPWGFGLKELTELRDALTVCIEEMQPAPAATDQRLPRVWHVGDLEPSGVAKVTDKDGDTWKREAEDWRFETLTDPWPRLVANYGPLTEVLP